VSQLAHFNFSYQDALDKHNIVVVVVVVVVVIAVVTKRKQCDCRQVAAITSRPTSWLASLY